MSNVIKVLIADDEQVITDILAKKIRDAGFEVITAYEGLSAWEKIKQEKPDVVVLDLTMPGLDGWGVLKNLRKDPPTKAWIPVIIVSALGDFDSVQRSQHLEADHYLTKPCKTEEVIKAIRMMITLAVLRNT